MNNIFINNVNIYANVICTFQSLKRKLNLWTKKWVYPIENQNQALIITGTAYKLTAGVDSTPKILSKKL